MKQQTIHIRNFTPKLGALTTKGITIKPEVKIS